MLGIRDEGQIYTLIKLNNMQNYLLSWILRMIGPREFNSIDKDYALDMHVMKLEFQTPHLFTLKDE